MKILQVSDIHIDLNTTRLGRLKIDKGVNQIHVERLRRLQILINLGINQRVDAIVLSGDVHDKTKPPPQEYFDLFQILDKIPEHIPTYILVGNHDEVTSKGFALSTLYDRRSHIKVFPADDLIEHQGMYFILASWNTSYNTIEQHVNSIANKSGPKILVGHAAITGLDNVNWGEVEGEKGTLTVTQLMNLNLSACMFGHYHGQTRLARGIWYCGSPECFNFGEREQVKGALLWEFDNNKLLEVDHIATKYPKYFSYTVQEFLNQVYALPEEGYLRITGEASETEKIAVMSKLNNFECIDYKLTFKSSIQKQKVIPISGKNNLSILQSYLIHKNIDDVLHQKLTELDSKLTIE